MIFFVRDFHSVSGSRASVVQASFSWETRPLVCAFKSTALMVTRVLAIAIPISIAIVIAIAIAIDFTLDW